MTILCRSVATGYLQLIGLNNPTKTMNKNKQSEQTKGDAFTQRVPTNIWKEQGSPSNPYIATKAYCYGYDFDEVIDQLSYVDSLYLMLTGNLPTSEQSSLLELCLKLFMTPGPRHPATRAAMNAGIGRTHVTHILPISLSVLSADYLGSTEVGNAMKFIQQHKNKDAKTFIESGEIAIDHSSPNPIPGFGTIYNGLDQRTLKFVSKVQSLNCEFSHFNWSQSFVLGLVKYRLSWLPTGLAAALFLDLQLDYRTGTCLFQMMQSPGLIAHGVEKANKPLTDMPFVNEDNYVIQK